MAGLSLETLVLYRVTNFTSFSPTAGLIIPLLPCLSSDRQACFPQTIFPGSPQPLTATQIYAGALFSISFFFPLFFVLRPFFFHSIPPFWCRRPPWRRDHGVSPEQTLRLTPLRSASYLFFSFPPPPKSHFSSFQFKQRGLGTSRKTWKAIPFAIVRWSPAVLDVEPSLII